MANMSDRLIYAAVLVCLLPLVWGVCQDLDTTSCKGLLAQNPNLCQEEVFSYTACARTCGNCGHWCTGCDWKSTVTCYHCDNPVSSYEECNNTKTCNLGEKCMLSSITSSQDGHAEFRMSCATNEMCDGKSIFFGRRDISTHCCSDDHCNSAPTTTTSTTSTTTTTTTTTTPMPTTTEPVCDRDVIFVVEDSRSRYGNSYVKDLLSKYVSSVQIGGNDNLVAVYLFDNRTHSAIRYETSQTENSLLKDIQNIDFNHRTNEINYAYVIRNIEWTLGLRWSHDRPNYPDVIVFISDHESHNNSHGTQHFGSGFLTNNFQDLSAVAQGIIVINVGTAAIQHSAFTPLATSTEYLFNINSYSSLPGLLDKLKELICR